MQNHQKLSGIAIIGVIATFIVAGTDAQKFQTCCTEVSRMEISGPIIGYRIQKWDPPCVRAVIFETERGEVCIHVKQAWVLRKIRQFERSRRNQISPTSSVPQYSTGTTVSTREQKAPSKSFAGTINILKGQTAEVTSPTNEWTPSSQTAEVTSLTNERTPSSQTAEVTSPTNEQTPSSQTAEVTSPTNEWTRSSQTAEVTSPTNEWTRSSQVAEVTSPTNERTPSSQTAEVTSPTNELT
ncbi:hypothetical protein ANANG_G00082660, partial [Anguilla anguilla]